jgi:hypothetical protein
MQLVPGVQPCHWGRNDAGEKAGPGLCFVSIEARDLKATETLLIVR